MYKNLGSTMFYQAIEHMLKGINQQIIGRALKKKPVEPVRNQVLICFDLNSNSSKAT